jgi:hypothetical protein
MVKAGKDFGIFRAWHSYGAFDVNVKANIDNSRAAGFKNIDVYLFPCRAKDAKS